MTEGAAGKTGVVISGENPGLTLYRPGTDDVIVRASYWRSVYSAGGDGNALLIWVNPDDAPEGLTAPHAIYTDNPAMARIVTDRFTQYFGGFDQLGFGGMQTSLARFTQDGDGRWYHRVTCNTGDMMLELTWANPLQHNLLQRDNYELGPSSYTLATVICPCAFGSLAMNEHTLAGEARVTEGETMSSSAFLAFSETWVGPLEG